MLNETRRFIAEAQIPPRSQARTFILIKNCASRLYRPQEHNIRRLESRRGRGGHNWRRGAARDLCARAEEQTRRQTFPRYVSFSAALLLALQPLLPLAPKPIARRLVVSARPTLPTPQSSPEGSPVLHQNPPRPRHPTELLTHRFMPLGSLAPIEGETEAAMDVDVPAPTQSSKSRKESANAAGEDGEAPRKKRKSGMESPKKSKKTKAVS